MKLGDSKYHEHFHDFLLKLISVPDDQGMTKRAGKIIEEFKDLVFPPGYEPGKKRVRFLFQ